MAKSDYEYVKEFEVCDRLPPHNWIVLKIDGCDFDWFTAEHSFEKPNDENALKLMNSCAQSMLEKFSDIVFAYGVNDEYSFIWKETTEIYERRASKIVSVSVSYFTSVYVMKWKEFFPDKELKWPPYFDGQVVCCPRVKFIQGYLSWKQLNCHINNQYNTCFWNLVNSGKEVKEAEEIRKKEKEAEERLKGTHENYKNELLFQQFGINYNTLPAMFRKGSCIFRDKVKEIVKKVEVIVKQDEQGNPVKHSEVIVKLDERGNPVERERMKVTVGHFKINPKFWEEHSYILKETN